MNNSAKKISLLIDSSEMGGIETHIAQLVKGLALYRIKPDVVMYQNHQPKHPLFKQLKKKDCNLVLLNGSIQALKNYLVENTELLHTHGYKAGIIGRGLAKLLKLPVVSTFHNGDPGKGRLYFYNLVDRFTSYLSENISVRDSISKNIPAKSRTIPNFVDIPNGKLRFSQRNEVAFIGRLSHEKGPDIFAEVARELPYEFSCYGEGPLKESIQSNNPNIKFHGHVDMEEHWHKIRLIVLTSRHEGMPMVALEAFARGIPIVASNVGGLPLLLKRSGLRAGCPIENLSQFRNQIDTFMNYSQFQYEHLANQVQQYVIDHHSTQTQTPSVLYSYSKALGAHAI